ncbi:MAG: lytic murein transglycosylase [Deltaproteobacteria bacterium ADurb.Bin026]|jgi:soluble lytic murein transglycosylase|nr:MAG: lytic murein transglycosylase [Deltaproteobacteria bacterium ADurb.Bin026]
MNTLMEKRRKYVFVFIPLLIGFVLFSTHFASKAFCNSDSHKEMVINEIVNFLKKNNIKLSNSRLLKMTNTLYDECKLNDIDYRLVLAIIKVESNFRHNITSRDGSKGLMQLKPSLAKFIAKNNGIDYKSSKDLQEPDKNIRIGTFHISKLIDDFENIHQALFAYNVGQKKAKGKIFEEDEPLTPFTKKVMKEYRKNISILPEQ